MENKFKKAAWINSTNLYEVNLRQYSPEGTITTFMKELPRLLQMGVETLWFMPLTPIATENRKGTLGSYYACSDYRGINPEFGNKNDLKELVAKAHEMGFKIVIDWVANHTGWGHVWTVDHPAYYKLEEDGTFKMASGMEDIIELNYDNTEMRTAMIGAMLHWIMEYDIDGFRCDLASWVPLDFWMEARASLEKTKTLFWLAEADALESVDYLQAFDAAYAWTWMHKTKDFYEKKLDFPQLIDLVKKYNAVCGDENSCLWFTSNHDENSWNGTEFEKYGELVDVLNVFGFTWNGIPLLYSGQELPNYKRLAFFDKDPIEWNGTYARQAFYSALLTLHSSNPALRTADEAVQTFLPASNEQAKTFSFLRTNKGTGVLVLLNFSNEALQLSLSLEEMHGKYKDVFSGVIVEIGRELSMELAPWGYKLYEMVS